MAQGKLASVLINSVNTYTQIYQVPVGFSAAVTVNICNQGTSNAKIRLAIPSSTTVNPVDVIEYDCEIYPSDSFQRNLVLSSGDYIYVRSNQGSVSVNVWGVTEQ